MRDISQQDVMGQVFWYWVPVVFYAGAIFYFSTQSHPEDQLPSIVFQAVSDKVLHAGAYGILSILSYRAFRWSAGPAAARQAAVLAILTASFYGITDEAHQAFVPFRDSSWLDWLADTIGAAIGVISWRLIRPE